MFYQNLPTSGEFVNVIFFNILNGLRNKIKYKKTKVHTRVKYRSTVHLAH